MIVIVICSVPVLAQRDVHVGTPRPASIAYPGVQPYVVETQSDVDNLPDDVTYVKLATLEMEPLEGLQRFKKLTTLMLGHRKGGELFTPDAFILLSKLTQLRSVCLGHAEDDPASYWTARLNDEFFGSPESFAFLEELSVDWGIYCDRDFFENVGQLPGLRALNIANIEEGIPEEDVALAFRSDSRLERVRVYSYNKRGTGGLLAEAIADLPYLTELTLDGYWREGTLKSVSNCPKLRALYLGYMNYEGNSTAGSLALSKLQFLQILYVTQGGLDNDALAVAAASMPALEELFLLKGDHGTKGQLKEKGLSALAASKSLRVFSVSNNKPLAEGSIGALARIESLESVVLRFMETTDNDLKELSRSKSISELVLIGAQTVSDVGLSYLSQMKSLRVLRHLRNEYVTAGDDGVCRVTDAGVAGLLESNQILETLYLLMVPTLTTKTFALMGSHPALQELGLEWCNLDAEGSKALQASKTIKRLTCTKPKNVEGFAKALAGIDSLDELRFRYVADDWPPLIELRKLRPKLDIKLLTLS
ncbi:MAG: hypothetical protein KDB68_15230 [Planctomycetes bacterium]|nr:hypothetical protein [Planctomycetota bacterium]